jgi:hypothetical protein
MLPRVAMTTGTAQPSPALAAGASVDAAALANLRADVLLRLIETMLKHMPRMGEPSPSRDLLETLLLALKALPGREGEGGRKLADLIAKLPPELRLSVEKLMNTVLSAMPTRSLVEIVRNPNGPEAQKLAALLATSLAPDDLHAIERQQKPLGLTAQQLAAVGRHGTQQAAQTPGDARLLQTTLKRIFDLDTGKPRQLTGSGTEAAGREIVAARTDSRPPTTTAKAGEQRPADASTAVHRHNGSAEDLQAAAPVVKREEPLAKGQSANAAGQAFARSDLQAVARDVPPALLMQAVAHMLETLSPEEANLLRVLLERPLDAMNEQDAGFIETAVQEEMTGTDAREVGKPQPALATPPKVAAQDEPMPMQHREGVQPAAIADAMPDKLLPAAVLREGVPLAFVPYLPAEEDLASPDTREAKEDEADDEDQTEDEDAGGGEAQEDADGEEAGSEPEAADMARRREKTAEMVGVIEPGLSFYQKLGDYWT